MSPKLKPLLLPQLVEERRKAEVESTAFGETSVYLQDNNSSSDLITPLTPTFSHRGSHMRGSSSVSSLDIPPIPTLPCSEGPSSPNPASHATHAGVSHGKRSLPDVQEEDLWEREEHDVPYHEDAHWCLCITADNCQCHMHRVNTSMDMCHSTIPSPEAYEPVDWDLGSLSDSDFSTRSSSLRKRRMMAANSTISGLTTRLNSRLSGLSRWRSTSRRRADSTFTVASETALDRDPSMSRTRSSRSSSLSTPGRPIPDRTHEPPLPPTPALSFYESTDSLAIRVPVDPVDLEPVDVGYGLERDRAMATTPLLPPCFTDQAPMSQPPSVPQSPLQSPSIAPVVCSPDLTLLQQLPSPPLSTKISISSFRPTPCASLVVSAPASPTEIPSPIPAFHLLGPQDAWSDRLGHANFIITPEPYNPEAADVESLRLLRGDWDRARSNYTKHLVRTGEHYGTTSKTYGLTEAKWAETEGEWKMAQDSVLERITAAGGMANDPELRRPENEPPSTAPPMLDAEKFPDLGDEDIVGPMLRDAVMVRGELSGDDKSSASKFWKSLVDKVGALRK